MKFSLLHSKVTWLSCALRTLLDLAVLGKLNSSRYFESTWQTQFTKGNSEPLPSRQRNRLLLQISRDKHQSHIKTCETLTATNCISCGFCFALERIKLVTLTDISALPAGHVTAVLAENLFQRFLFYNWVFSWIFFCLIVAVLPFQMMVLLGILRLLCSIWFEEKQKTCFRQIFRTVICGRVTCVHSHLWSGL